MSRTLVIVTVCCGAYALLNVATSTFVALLWRTRAVAPANLPPRTRARRLFLLRLVPSVSAAAVTLAVVAPAFAIFEPPDHGEKMGPVMGLLAIAAVFQFAVSAAVALWNLWQTKQCERAWLRDAESIDGPAGLPAYAVESSTPIVALVGVFSPKLIAARNVLDACTSDEIARIVAHECGHFQSRDNLKRWVMSWLPDALQWTRVHREIVDAWDSAAEDAADDATTSGEPVERAELAALLLKIVRLASLPSWNTVAVSPFVQDDGLERRVKRLLKPELEPPAPVALVPLATATAATLAIMAIVSSPHMLEQVFRAFEQLVALGR